MRALINRSQETFIDYLVFYQNLIIMAHWKFSTYQTISSISYDHDQSQSCRFIDFQQDEFHQKLVSSDWLKKLCRFDSVLKWLIFFCEALHWPWSIQLVTMNDLLFKFEVNFRHYQCTSTQMKPCAISSSNIFK